MRWEVLFLPFSNHVKLNLRILATNINEVKKTAINQENHGRKDSKLREYFSFCSLEKQSLIIQKKNAFKTKPSDVDITENQRIISISIKTSNRNSVKESIAHIISRCNSVYEHQVYNNNTISANPSHTYFIDLAFNSRWF